MTKSQKKILEEYLDNSKIDLSEESLKIVNQYIRKFKNDDDYSDWDKVVHAVQEVLNDEFDRDYDNHSKHMEQKLEKFKELTDDERKQIIDDLNYTSTDMVDNNTRFTKSIFNDLLLTDLSLSDEENPRIPIFSASFFWLGMYTQQLSKKQIETANKSLIRYFREGDTKYISNAISNNPAILMTPFFQFIFLNYLNDNPKTLMQRTNQWKDKLISNKSNSKKQEETFTNTISRLTDFNKKIKENFSVYEDIIKAIYNGLIPKGRSGRKFKSYNTKNIKIEYKLLLKEYLLFFRNKNIEIRKLPTPTTIYHEITNPKILSTIFQGSNIISDKEKQYIKKIVDAMHNAKMKGAKLKRYQKVQSVEYLVKHVLSIRHNSSCSSIEMLLQRNKK